LGSLVFPNREYYLYTTEYPESQCQLALQKGKCVKIAWPLAKKEMVCTLFLRVAKALIKPPCKTSGFQRRG
jgi:hypothetical protein